MARIAYNRKAFRGASLKIIAQANAICAEYERGGLILTLRQLYYQFVARDLLPNKQTEYKRLGSILNDARMAGVMDWKYLIDRTRNLESLAHWDSPDEIVRAVSEQYRTDLWANQKTRVEVWIEKDAAIGVIESVCRTNDVPYLSCRGYTSVSEMHVAAQRIGRYLRDGSRVVILHIGDHDPSGMDMSRDIEERLETFIYGDWYNSDRYDGPAKFADIREAIAEHVTDHGARLDGDENAFEIRRIALNYDQVQQYNPPPNPAKQTDARYTRYVEMTGLDESWELDALDPYVLQELIQSQVDGLKDEEVWAEAAREMENERQELVAVSDEWFDIIERLTEAGVIESTEAE